jgi:hypothetical protein
MYRGPRGRPLLFREKAAIFMAWLGIGLIVLTAAGIAFFTSCLAAFFAGSVEGYGPGAGALIVGTTTALAVAAGLLMFFWRRYTR